MPLFMKKHIFVFKKLDYTVSSRDGHMRLINRNSKAFNRIQFGNSLDSLTLIGDGFHYTYRIPDEILAIKSD